MELLWAVLATSFLGSLHCAGMCGGVVAFIAGSSHRGMTQISYHLGRAISYSTMGALCGGLGGVLDLGGESLGVGRVAMTAAGVIMILYGLSTFLQARGLSLPRIPWLSFLDSWFQKGMRSSTQRGPWARGLSIGLLSVLLPCGWLYVFAATAAASGHPFDGALTMLVFWLGTVPVLAILGASIQKIAAPIRSKIPTLTSLLLVLIGLLTLSGRLSVPSFAAKFATPTTAEEGIRKLSAPDAAEPPCCASEEAAPTD
ncbi:MAG: sulfite exporter TauE/SafE family protein [Planctomycetes bacterium]|jgi:uncharacterized protein|nr:sulfite exporter TauE/SafE family protein [Planctomycetota bacterium]MBT4028187.1 sulfite exporter TauE/SafE family protein [Planctomycetota bacterium]MBT4559769.1 sulfite exporter TauE/SafE family protein [Planctomycetota bacterium]MBT5101349.1 sulfite exporter TauE/SafE family protein [Planctomycetota bacterium]MBT5120097.1 sulfite exporter TauE/SafE family protein [Planctomycetota bacterium]